MKVLLLSWYSQDFIFGGVETAFRNLSKLLGADWINLNDVLKSLNIVPILNEYYRFAIVDRSYYISKYIEEYEKIYDVDIIIADDCTIPWYKPKARLITIAQNPYKFIADKLYPEFYSMHNYIEFSKLYTLLQSIQYENSDAIVCPSKYMKSYVESLTKNRNIYVIPHLIDFDLFKPMDKEKLREKYNIPDDRIIGLWVGAFHPVKGWHIAQNLIRKFNDIYWICVFKHSVYGRPILDNVRIFSNVEYERMPEIYNLADFYISTSLVEAFGLCPIEAAACDVPIIVPRVGYFSDYKEGSYFFGIVTDNLEKGVIDTVNYLKSFDDYNEVFGKPSPRESIIGIFDRNIIIEKWKNLIDNIKYKYL